MKSISLHRYRALHYTLATITTSVSVALSLNWPLCLPESVSSKTISIIACLQRCFLARLIAIFPYVTIPCFRANSQYIRWNKPIYWAVVAHMQSSIDHSHVESLLTENQCYHGCNFLHGVLVLNAWDQLTGIVVTYGENHSPSSLQSHACVSNHSGSVHALKVPENMLSMCTTSQLNTVHLLK